MVANETNGPTMKLVARTLEEAKQKLFDEYNTDYEIIDKRVALKGGFFGIGQHETCEVFYRTKPRSKTYNRPSNGYDSFNKNQEELLKRLNQKTLVQSNYNAQFSELSKQLTELTNKIDSKTMGSNETHPTIERIEELLSNNEFTYNYIKRIKDRIKSEFSLDELEDFDKVQRCVVDWIGESIKVAPERIFRTPHTVIIVGPTGVGKTTTLVKLAAQYVLSAQKQNKKVQLCFITTDTMRVGALEQLSRFGELFGLNVKKAENAEDVRTIYEDVKDSVDAIFIDTSGYSPNDSAHIGAMKATLDVPGINPDVYLAVTASTKARDLANIMQNYEPFGYKSVIITKCDESNQYGNVISVLNEKNKCVSYITNGQKAAGCIEKANPVNLLIRLEDFNIDRIHIEDKFGVN